jgi:hypothetical protein
MNLQQRTRAFALLSVLATACAGPAAPPSSAPAVPAPETAVVRRPIDSNEPSGPPATNVAAMIAKAPNALYVCVADASSQRKDTVIELAPNVLSLCQRHPEMGPCQYERDLCRKSGGRVFTADGREITRAVEDEYDRKVMRVRFRAN